MGGFFGTVAKADCVADVFYGTDYNSHLGTKRGGLATYNTEKENLSVLSTTWKAPISARSLKTNWIRSKGIPE
ncbi:amidophosphoribosyltransferase [Bacteroides heparinolyticus]|uniref:Amidophosphoribosyltransferase n=1 Tax=Prevotella heparinolytica TaxID=28113 RepID=A0A449I0C0_9BACE|nr:amidophosphoribosyltransferase [Bacteroides heparinolyticus]